MILSPTQAVWSAAGRPMPTQRPVSARAGLCAVCGGSDSTHWTTLADGLSDAFSDFRDLRQPSSPDICAACVWAMQGKPPNCLRMWSVLWREDGLVPPSRDGAPSSMAGPGVHLNNKGDMSAFVEALLSPPPCVWIGAVAETGQIHTVPFSTLNMPNSTRWSVRLERGTVTSDSQTLGRVLHHATSLLAAGYSKGDVETLTPHPASLRKAMQAWRDHAPHLVDAKGSRLLDLALILVRKETIEDVRRRTEQSGRPVGPRDDAKREHGQDRPAGLVEQSTDGAGDSGGQLVVVEPVRVEDGGKAQHRRAARRERHPDLFGG